MKKGLEEIGTLSVEEAQTFSQHLNQNLKAFYKNWNANDIGRSTVEALVNNNLKKAIDESIENALGQGEQYSHLKKQYGQLRNIEEEVAKRALVDQRKNTKNLFDLTDIYSANQVIDSLANLNPIGLVKWGATSLIKNWYKKLNDPNVQIKKLFENIDKEISQNGELRKRGNRWTDTKEWINEKLGRKQEIDNQKNLPKGKEPTSADLKAIGGKEPTTITNKSIINNSSQKSNHSYQKVDGSIIEHSQGPKITDRDFLKRQFSNKFELPLADSLKQKIQLVDLIKIGELEKWNLGDVPAIAFNDGKIRPLELSTSIYEKIFKKHGPFSHENLITTANDWDYLIKNLNWIEGHINLLKELPDGKALLIGARRENGAFVLTHFEPTKSLKDVLEDAKNNGGEVIEKGLDKLREWAETTQELTLYRGLKEGGKKKFSFDAYTDSKKVARWYGEKIITEKISPKKLADFSNPSDGLLQIIKDNWKGGKWYDIERLRKLATAEKFSAGANMYEIFDDVNVRNALKNAGYDYVKFNDFGKDFKPHTTYFATDVESRWPKSKVLNESREEKITLKSAYQWDWNLAPIINRLGTKGSKTMKILDVSNNVKTILKKMWVESEIKGHYLSSNWVQHILKRHGEWAKDLKFYEIPVSIEDIKLIPKIISEADEIMPSPKTTGKLNRPAIIYKKKMGNKYYYVESVNTKDGKLEPQSMYINKP